MGHGGSRGGPRALLDHSRSGEQTDEERRPEKLGLPVACDIRTVSSRRSRPTEVLLEQVRVLLEPAGTTAVVTAVFKILIIIDGCHSPAPGLEATARVLTPRRFAAGA